MDICEDKYIVYRPCVGIVLINEEALVFMGRRSGTKDGWQMPQGGIDHNESPKNAALRELQEEIGTNKVQILTETEEWFYYQFPEDIACQYRLKGQKQKWIVARFKGENRDIRLDGHGVPEFDAWTWGTPKFLLEKVIHFKREVYEMVFRKFAYFIKATS